MKRIRNFILTAAYALCAATAVAQSGNPELTYEYDAGKKGYIFTKYNGSSNSVTISPTYDDGSNGVASVVGIKNLAFRGKTTVKSLSLPSTLKEIGASAFAGMTQLATIDIPESVVETGASTFDGCTALTKVKFMATSAKSESMKTLPQGMFTGCKALVHVRFIPEWMTAIGDNAFQNCENLESVYIPCGVTKILGGAFRDCKNLTDVYCSAEQISLEGLNNFDRDTKSSRTLHLTSVNSNIYADGNFKDKWGNYFNDCDTDWKNFCDRQNDQKIFTGKCKTCHDDDPDVSVSSKGLGYINDGIAVNSSTPLAPKMNVAGAPDAEVRYTASLSGSATTKAPAEYITEFVPDKAGRWLITATEISGKFKIYKYITVK